MNKNLVLIVVAAAMLSGCKSVSVRHTVELPVQVVESHHVHHPQPILVVPPSPVIVQQHVHVPTPQPPVPMHAPGPVVVVKPQRPVPPGLQHHHPHGAHPQPPQHIYRPLPAASYKTKPMHREPIIASQVRQVAPSPGNQAETGGAKPLTAGRGPVTSPLRTPVPQVAVPRNEMPSRPAGRRDREAEQESVQEPHRGWRG